MLSILGVSALSQWNPVLLISLNVWSIFVSGDSFLHDHSTLDSLLDFSVERELSIERQCPEVGSYHMRNLRVINVPSCSRVLSIVLP